MFLQVSLRDWILWKRNQAVKAPTKYTSNLNEYLAMFLSKRFAWSHNIYRPEMDYELFERFPQYENSAPSPRMRVIKKAIAVCRLFLILQIKRVRLAMDYLHLFGWRLNIGQSRSDPCTSPGASWSWAGQGQKLAALKHHLRHIYSTLSTSFSN